jgi:hypothetical protein
MHQNEANTALMIKTIALVSNVSITANLAIINEKSPMEKLLPLVHSNTLKINNKFCSNSLKWKKMQNN